MQWKRKKNTSQWFELFWFLNDFYFLWVNIRGGISPPPPFFCCLEPVIKTDLSLTSVNLVIFRDLVGAQQLEEEKSFSVAHLVRNPYLHFCLFHINTIFNIYTSRLFYSIFNKISFCSLKEPLKKRNLNNAPNITILISYDWADLVR